MPPTALFNKTSENEVKPEICPSVYGSCRSIQQSCVVVSVGTTTGEPARDSHGLAWDGGGSVGGGL